MDPNHQSRSDQLLRQLADQDRLVILTHDNPDPDAIAAGWALQRLIRERLNRHVRLIARGAIVRAENRHMLKLLNAPIELVQDLVPNEPTAAILVDCSPSTTDHSITHESVEAVAVIDHHPPRQNGWLEPSAAYTGLSNRVPLHAGAPGHRFVQHRPSLHIPCRASAADVFEDIRPDVAASATIAASYLREQQVEPDENLATALLYAIRTETRGHETNHSPLDHSILSWLTERANPTKLADIENAPLTRDYFGDLLLAVQSTFLYGGAALCLLPRAHGPEIVGEVADLLVRCEGVRQVLCGAAVGHDIILSARTQRGCGDAVELLRQTIEGFGVGGGHTHRAGGKIPRGAMPATGFTSAQPRIPDEMEDELRSRWLRACGVERRRGTRLVAKRQIVENL